MKTEPIVVEAIINAPVARTWKAITDKEQMKAWYFDITDFEPQVGTTFNFYEPGGANRYHHRGTVKEVVLDEKFQHTWTHPSHSKGESLLTWQLEPQNGQTKVTLTHEGIENFADGGSSFSRESYEAGWKEIVGESLKSFLEDQNIQP